MKQSCIQRTLGWGILIVLLAGPVIGQQAALPETRTSAAGAKEDLPDPAKILRQASELALNYDKVERFWWDRPLLDIACVQMWAQDFEGARKSILGSKHHSRLQSLEGLAEACARHGQLDQALDVVREYQSGDGFRKNLAENDVRIRSIENLIENGDLESATKTVELPSSLRVRPDGLRKLAIAYAQAGDKPRAAGMLVRAAKGAVDLKNNYALREIAETQLSLGDLDAAKVTIETLLARVDKPEAFTKSNLLSTCAVLMAKSNDQKAARDLFASAIDACNKIATGNKPLDDANKAGSLARISIDQASIGDFENAFKTVSLIERSDSQGHSRADHDQALCAISVAQTDRGDIPAALDTAMLIEGYSQYRDDALVEIADYHIRKKQHKSALEIAHKINEDLLQAIILLKIANAHAKSGDAKAAEEVASGINMLLDREDRLSHVKHDFQIQQPRTWVANNFRGGTMAMMRHHSQRRREIAANAMILIHHLGREPDEPYEFSFKDIHVPEILRKLTRAHAASGDASKALAWAQQIGTIDGDRESVELRIEALIGVAEGILEKQSEPNQEPLPLDVRLHEIGRGRYWVREWYRRNGSLHYWQMNPFN